MKQRIVLVDLDGTLCEEVCWTKQGCKEAKPVQRVIDRVNELYKLNFVVIYTARRDGLIPASLEWLRRNGVHFHAFSNIKCPADYYLDDRSLRPDEDFMSRIK